MDTRAARAGSVVLRVFSLTKKGMLHYQPNSNRHFNNFLHFTLSFSGQTEDDKA